MRKKSEVAAPVVSGRSVQGEMAGQAEAALATLDENDNLAGVAENSEEKASGDTTGKYINPHITEISVK